MNGVIRWGREQQLNRGVWRKRLIVIVLAVAVFVTVLPEAIRWGGIYWLPSTGMGEVEIEEVDLNLFTGRASLQKVELFRESQSKLSFEQLDVDLSWQKLLFGIIHLEDISLRGLSLAIVEADDGSLEVVVPLASSQREAQPEAKPDSALVLPKISVAKFSLLETQLTLLTTHAKGLLQLDRFVVAQASTWLNESIVLELAGDWNQAPINAAIELNPWAAQPYLAANVSFSKLGLEGFSLLAGEPLTGAVDLALDVSGDWDWQGNMQLGMQTRLGLSNLLAGYKNFQLDLAGFNWLGEISLARQKQLASYQVQGNLDSQALRLTDIKQKLALLAWQEFNLENVFVDEKRNVQFTQLHAENLYTLSRGDDDQGRFFAGAVDIQQWDLQEGQHLHIGKSQIKDAQYQVTVNNEGDLQIQTMLGPVLASLSEQAEDGVEEAAVSSASMEDDDSSATEFTVSVGETSLVGDSGLFFTDQRFKVPVKQHIKLNRVSIEGMDQRTPDKAAQLTVDASLGEFSKIAFDGDIKPFAENLGLDLKGNFKAIPLPSVSPYSEAYLGYHLTRGQYDHDFSLRIADNAIDLENTLLLRQLQLTSVDSSKLQPMEQQLDVPLKFALNMLRDGDDNIELSIPIKGQLDDPNISVSSVLNKALGKAVKSGATSYLTLALQPYGAVLMAANMVGDQLSSIQLDPVEYVAGQAELTGPHQDYLLKISTLLMERPKMQLTACASANNLDREALQLLNPKVPVSDELLIALATQRGSVVKRELLAKGVTAERVFLCQPTLQQDAISGVELSM
jgi:Domain of Unknown Function (DUF748)